MTPFPPPRILAAILAPAAVLALGIAAMPTPPSFSTSITGDRALGESLRPDFLEAGALDRAAVAVVDGKNVTFTGFGAESDTEFEIGSITKAMNAQLFQDAIDRGEVRPTDRLEERVPELLGTPAGGVILRDLATHTSGLPGLPTDAGSMLGVLLDSLRHQNPYHVDTAEMITLAAAEALTTPGEYVYSNLGTALLGQALARTAGIDYADLIRTRLFEPLGMGDTRVTTLPGEEGKNATTGFSATGVHENAWAIGGYVPAGGVRSTAADMSRYVVALLAGTAPGMAALDPVPGTEGGLAWMILDTETDQTLTVHNGQTGGFSSFLMLDREAGRGVITLSNTAAQHPAVAYNILTGTEK